MVRKTGPYFFSASSELPEQFLPWFMILFIFLHFGHFSSYLYLQGQGLLIKKIIVRAYPRAWHREHSHKDLLTAEIRFIGVGELREVVE